MVTGRQLRYVSFRIALVRRTDPRDWGFADAVPSGTVQYNGEMNCERYERLPRDGRRAGTENCEQEVGMFCEAGRSGRCEEHGTRTREIQRPVGGQRYSELTAIGGVGSAVGSGSQASEDGKRQ